MSVATCKRQQQWSRSPIFSPKILSSGLEKNTPSGPTCKLCCTGPLCTVLETVRCHHHGLEVLLQFGNAGRGRNGARQGGVGWLSDGLNAAQLNVQLGSQRSMSDNNLEVQLGGPCMWPHPPTLATHTQAQAVSPPALRRVPIVRHGCAESWEGAERPAEGRPSGLQDSTPCLIARPRLLAQVGV